MGLLRMAARTAVVAGTATAVSGRVARRQARKYDQPAEEEQSAPAQGQPEEAPAEESPYDQLRQLGELHSQGVLSDDEFTAAKAKILGI